MTNSNYSKKERLGFTLIELLVAMAIFGLVATVVYTTLYTSIKAYHRTQAELGLNQDVQQILDRLSKELRNCHSDAYQEEDKGGFRADAHSLSFYAIKDIYFQSGYEKSIARFSYRFENGKLLKKSQVDKDVFGQGEDFEEEELLKDIQSLTFEYLYFKKVYNEGEYPYEWKTEWDQKFNIPRAVRIKIVKVAPKDNLSINIIRHIYLPQGVVEVQK